MFVVILTYCKPLEEMDRLRPPHLEFLDRYYAKGIFLASGRQTPLVGGVILARGCTRLELEKILAEDPFAVEQAADYQIIEFTANKHHPALAGLV